MFKEILWGFVICGLSAAGVLSDSKISGRIFEGNYVPSATSFPFTVFIYTSDSGSGQFGAGTIITANAILCTARQLQFGHVYEIGYGSHLKSQQVHQVAYPQHVIYYPQYNNTVISHNIAIIRLPIDIAFNVNTQPVRLARRSYAVTNIFVGSLANIVGWGGYDADQIFLSNNLRYTTVIGISNAICQNTYAPELIIGSSMCTHGYNNVLHNACSGDAGGPLLIQENNEWTQIGVIAFGFGCPTQTPTGYASVAFYLNWISQISGVVIRD